MAPRRIGAKLGWLARANTGHEADYTALRTVAILDIAVYLLYLRMRAMLGECDYADGRR